MTEQQQLAFVEAIRRGATITAAAQLAGVSSVTAHALRKRPTMEGIGFAIAWITAEIEVRRVRLNDLLRRKSAA